MKFSITSHRGHHECDLLEVDVQEAIFNKMTGKRHEALPIEYKTKVPDTFEELAGLWKDGNLNYTAISFDKEKEPISFKVFNPEAEEVAFIAMETGG